MIRKVVIIYNYDQNIKYIMIQKNIHFSMKFLFFGRKHTFFYEICISTLFALYGMIFFVESLIF